MKLSLSLLLTTLSLAALDTAAPLPLPITSPAKSYKDYVPQATFVSLIPAAVAGSGYLASKTILKDSQWASTTQLAGFCGALLTAAVITKNNWKQASLTRSSRTWILDTHIGIENDFYKALQGHLVNPDRQRQQQIKHEGIINGFRQLAGTVAATSSSAGTSESPNAIHHEYPELSEKIKENLDEIVTLNREDPSQCRLLEIIEGNQEIPRTARTELNKIYSIDHDWYLAMLDTHREGLNELKRGDQNILKASIKKWSGITSCFLSLAGIMWKSFSWWGSKA